MITPEAITKALGLALAQGRYLPGLCASFGAALNVARDAAEAYMTCGHYLDNPRWVVVDPSGALVTTVQP